MRRATFVTFILDSGVVHWLGTDRGSVVSVADTGNTFGVPFRIASQSLYHKPKLASYRRDGDRYVMCGTNCFAYHKCYELHHPRADYLFHPNTTF